MANGNKTLIILTPGFPKNESDSTCLPAQQAFVKAVNKNFSQLRIIILAFEYPFTESTYRWHGNTVISFDGWKKRKIKKLFLWLRIWRKLKQLQKENDIVGIISFWFAECALIGKYFAKYNQLEHFSWILGQDARQENKFIKWAHPQGKELIAMSDFLAKEFYKNYSVRPLHVIPNGIDTSQFNMLPLERDIDILGVGSLIPLKQYDLFIELISELKQYLPSINVLICGKGEEKDHLQSLIDKLHLQDNISLLGERSHEEILQLMQRSKILLHTSSYEGFSTVCLEALYAGAHVISFCNPMMEWVRHWHIATSREDMLQLLIEILQDPDTDHKPVLPYSINDSAKAVMKLFNYNEAAIS